MIRELINRFYPNKIDYNVAAIGLNAAGKTPLLYHLQAGEVVTTIPIIGLAIDSLKMPAGRGRSVNFSCLDVGSGCSIQSYKLIWKLVPLPHAVIWVLDSNYQEAINECKEELTRALPDLYKAAEEGNYCRDIPIMILANKQDLPGAMSPEDVHKNFKEICKGHPFAVYKTSLTKDLATGGTREAFDWLLDAITTAQIGTGSGGPSTALEPSKDKPLPETLSSKIDSWVSRAENDSPPEELLHQFENLELPAWDHYTHVRVAYVILTKHGRQNGKNMIFDGIEKYVRQSNQAKSTQFHVTMTYFWIQMVHFGMRSMPSTDTTALEYTPSLEEFARFLTVNPYIADGRLWLQYYSKDLMMSPDARVGAVLPDLKPLPNVVGKNTVSSLTV